MNQSIFEVLSLNNVLTEGNHLKTQNILYTVYEHILGIWLPLAMKQLLGEIYFEFQHTVNFSYTWNKKT